MPTHRTQGYRCLVFNVSRPNRREVALPLALTHVPLVTSDIEDLFIHVLAIYISLLEKFFFQILTPFFKSRYWGYLFVCFLLLSCRSSLHFLEIDLLSDIRFANIFSHSVDGFFAVRKVFHCNPTSGLLSERIEIRISKRDSQSRVHCSTIHNSQHVGTS